MPMPGCVTHAKRNGRNAGATMPRRGRRHLTALFTWMPFGPDSIGLFVGHVAEALRSCGVLLYSKEGARRSGAAPGPQYRTAAPLEHCVEHVQMLGKIADVSRWAVRLPATVDQFPARDWRDACLLPVDIKRPRPASPPAGAANIEDHQGSPGKRPRRQGVWVFYNQAEDQDWPTRDDGPFREAWAEASVDAACFYGRVHSSGGGKSPSPS